MSGQFVDHRQVQRAFSRAAPGYDQADFLVREIDRRMQERLDYVRIAPQRLLDLGCGRGASLAGLSQRYPQAQACAVDLAAPMLAGVQAAYPSASRLPRWLSFGRPVAPGVLPALADAQQLPFKPASFGLLWANMLWHWLDAPQQAFAEAQRVLEVGGLLMFSTLGPDSFKELRASFNDGQVHTQRFADMHDLGDMLVEAGFSDPVVDMEVLTLTYRDFDTLMGELRASGGRCAMQGRRRALGGRLAWQAMRQAYEAQSGEAGLPVTLEIVYGHAWKAAPRQTEDGRAIIRFDRRR